MSYPSALKVTGIFIAVSLCVVPASGYAGFEWVVPSEAPIVQGAPSAALPSSGYISPTPAPVISSPEVISPVIIDGQHNSNVVATPSTSTPVTISSSNISRTANPPAVANAPTPLVANNQQPVVTNAPRINNTESGSMGGGMTGEVFSSAPVSSHPVMTASEAPASSSGDVVQGFAKQVPLAVALRQLLPPGYGFSIDQNVDLGILVSFQGGQPWRETLRAALEPVGLVMREQGQMVTITHGDQSVVAAATPPSKAISVGSIPVHGVQSGVTDSITAPAAETGTGPVVQSWSAERGDTLHQILEEWSRRANVEFDWQSEYDYPLQASVAFSGTFEDAVRNLLTGFEGAHPQPVAELHANSNLGQMVLVVSTRGNNYSD